MKSNLRFDSSSILRDLEGWVELKKKCSTQLNDHTNLAHPSKHTTNDNVNHGKKRRPIEQFRRIRAY